jgi:abortive infection bacteriophage resistance protein
MTAIDKKQFAATYNVSYTYFESWIESIAYVRNVCAHYGRLYNAKFTKKPKLYKQDIDSGISNSRVMGTLVCLKYLLPHDRHWIEFLDTLELLLEKYFHVQKGTMGFPENWKAILMGV